MERVTGLAEDGDPKVTGRAERERERGGPSTNEVNAVVEEDGFERRTAVCI